MAHQLVREGTYAFAAVSPCDGVIDSLILPEVNTEAMSPFPEEVSLRHPDESILLFLHRAGWHVSNQLILPSNIHLHPLPSYSPELNPTEHIWDEIHEKWFHNKAFLSLEAVEDTPP